MLVVSLSGLRVIAVSTLQVGDQAQRSLTVAELSLQKKEEPILLVPNGGPMCQLSDSFLIVS